MQCDQVAFVYTYIVGCEWVVLFLGLGVGCSTLPASDIPLSSGAGLQCEVLLVRCIGAVPAQSVAISAQSICSASYGL